MRFIWLLIPLTLTCSRPGDFRDVPRPRIVSLIPSATEILFGLGMGGHVVGATRYCDQPEQARAIPRVGGILDVSTEAVLAARPDLVIGSSRVLRGSFQELLHRSGAKTLPVDFDTMAAVIEGIAAIGKAVGRETKARHMVESLERDLLALKDRALRSPPVRVLFVAGRNPMVVASQASFIGYLLDRMGVENVVETRTVPYPTWSLEQVLRADPDVLLNGAVQAGDLGTSFASGGVRAAREGRVVDAINHTILRPGAGAGHAALELADRIVTEAGRLPVESPER